MSEQIGLPEQPPVPQVEQVERGEQKESVKKKEVVSDSSKEASEATLSQVQASTAVQGLPQTKPQKSETLERIEDIMEEDLDQVYKNLPPEIKKEFREKGEEAAIEIEGMMHQVKLQSKKVFKVLFGWMKIIPQVNRYFLKQEAKIKTDEIMDIKEELDKASHGQIES